MRKLSIQQNIFLSLFYIFILIFGSGCLPYKTVPYFQDINSEGEQNKINNTFRDPVIQKNDIIKITVSSLDAEVTRLFSFNSEQNPSTQNSSGSNYLVDPMGYIKMPLINPLKVEGLTTWQVRDSITNLLQPFLKEPVVEIRISSFRFAVMGDVGIPGIYSISNERVSILEAIALAGDLNITAKRDNVLLVRDENGERKFIRFNMNNKELYNSPYFYLRSNDLIYVQPGKITTRDVNFRNLTYLATIISLVALIASIIRN